MREGWLIDREGFWICRFHRDEKAWIRDPRVFVDHGREMPNGEPALLKRREYLRRDAAEQRWKELLRLGWSTTGPAWGAEVEP